MNRKPPAPRQNTAGEEEEKEMEFIFCEEREQRISKAVCEANMKRGKCTKDLLKCRKARTPKATEPEPRITISPDLKDFEPIQKILNPNSEKAIQFDLFPERKA